MEYAAAVLIGQVSRQQPFTATPRETVVRIRVQRQGGGVRQHGIGVGIVEEALEKGWKQRETTLKEREDDFARLQKEAEGFPARLQKEAQTAAEQSRKETEARFDQQILVLKKDAETEKRLATMQVNSLEESVARQQAQIVALEKQLADAKQQVQDIAVKAIEGASGAKALSHINQIAMEQAKNRPQG